MSFLQKILKKRIKKRMQNKTLVLAFKAEGGFNLPYPNPTQVRK